MRNKILAAAIITFMSFGAANVAKADCNGIYLGVRGGSFKPKIEKTTSLNGDFDIAKRGWSFSGALGYRYDYVRAELEVILRDDPEKKFKVGINTITENFESQSYMFNLFWDLSPYTMFTPYLMAGAGLTEIALSSSSTGSPTHDLESDNFTWVAGAGLSAKVTSRFNIDVGYRYFDMGKVKKAKINASEFYGGLRYVF